MNRNFLRGIATAASVVVLVMCLWYVWKTYREGEPRWYFLVMGMGIAMMLIYGVMGRRKPRK